MIISEWRPAPINKPKSKKGKSKIKQLIKKILAAPTCDSKEK